MNMNWYKIARTQSERQIIKKIKHILRSEPFFQKMMKDYHIPSSDVDDNLEIEFADLGGKYGEGNGSVIRLDKSLLDNDFFGENFHFLVHEFFHWIKRRSEELFYFNDPEEIQSFTLAIAWEMLQGKSLKSITTRLFPIIEGHYKNEDDAWAIYKKMVSKARQIKQHEDQVS